MDLNVKLQRLKYNFRKVQGCFCKTGAGRGFFGFKGIMFLLKIAWNRFTVLWIGSMVASSHVQGTTLNHNRSS
jgi:hypothetical protein